MKDEDKTKIENIKRQEGIKEGINRRKSMLGLCSFHSKYCDPTKLLKLSSS